MNDVNLRSSKVSDVNLYPSKVGELNGYPEQTLVEQPIVHYTHLPVEIVPTTDIIELAPEAHRKAIEDLLTELPVIPLNDQLVVWPLPKRERVSAGGIMLPETAQEVSLEGVVIAVGPGWYDSTGAFHRNPFMPGMHIIFHQYASSVVSLRGIDFLYMNSRDVMMVVKNASVLRRQV